MSSSTELRREGDESEDADDADDTDDADDADDYEEEEEEEGRSFLAGTHHVQQLGATFWRFRNTAQIITGSALSAQNRDLRAFYLKGILRTVKNNECRGLS